MDEGWPALATPEPLPRQRGSDTALSAIYRLAKGNYVRLLRIAFVIEVRQKPEGNSSTRPPFCEGCFSPLELSFRLLLHPRKKSAAKISPLARSNMWRYSEFLLFPEKFRAPTPSAAPRWLPHKNSPQLGRKKPLDINKTTPSAFRLFLQRPRGGYRAWHPLAAFGFPDCTAAPRLAISPTP